MRQCERSRKPKTDFVSVATREQRICCNGTRDLFRWVAIERRLGEGGMWKRHTQKASFLVFKIDGVEVESEREDYSSY